MKYFLKIHFLFIQYDNRLSFFLASRVFENYFYTCDKQVLWESAGAFFPRDNSLISRGNSHVSRVRGLVVRCLLFNPEVSCSNPWICANFFYKYSEAEVSDFFRHYETFRLCETFFGFVRLFFRNFLNVPKESSFQFF